MNIENKRKVKIVHLTHSDVARDVRIVKQLECLASSGGKYKFDLLGCGLDVPSMGPVQTHAYQVSYKSIGLQTSKLPTWMGLFRSLAVFIEMTIKFLIVLYQYRPDIIHCHDFPLLTVSLLYTTIQKNILIYDAHELESEQYLKGSEKKIKTFLERYFVKALESIAWNKIDLFISVSDSIIEWYQKTYGEKNSILILNSPIFLSSAKQNRKVTQKPQLGLPAGMAVFAYVGYLGNGRGIEKIVKTFKRDDIKSHVIFLGWGDFETSIKNEAAENSKIHFKTAVTQTELMKFLEHVDYGFCLVEAASLSDYYCLPNKLFEYFFSGTKVISSKLPEIAKLIDFHDAGYLVGDEEEGLVNLVKSLQKEKVCLSKTRFECYGWDVQSRRLRENYWKLLG